MSIVVTVLILIFRYPLMDLFTHNEPNVVLIGGQYLVIVSSCYIIFSVMFSYNGVLRGAGDTLVPMFITLFALWGVRVPAAIILSKYLGADGIWWSVPVGWLVGTICSIFYYLTGKWKNKGVFQRVGKS
ncbi:MAG: hypothetical protein MI922_14960 [Bacteroidales bacterium]|nr:hypothetical protein [Bacteroidales bacterium]